MWVGRSCSVSRKGVHTHEPLPVRRGLMVEPALLGLARAPSRLLGEKGRVVRPRMCPRWQQPWGTRDAVGSCWRVPLASDVWRSGLDVGEGAGGEGGRASSGGGFLSFFSWSVGLRGRRWWAGASMLSESSCSSSPPGGRRCPGPSESSWSLSSSPPPGRRRWSGRSESAEPSVSGSGKLRADNRVAPKVGRLRLWRLAGVIRRASVRR